MANSKYEYVKSYEVEDEVFLPNLMVIRIDGRDFRRFSQVHEFEKPNDEVALNLMNSCATSVSEVFPDIVFSYGFCDEYSFVFKKTSKFHQRRARLYLVPLLTSSNRISCGDKPIVSSHSGVWRMEVTKSSSNSTFLYKEDISEFFHLPLHSSGHTNNLHSTCLWELIKFGKTESEALELKDTSMEEKNDLLFEKFGINYQKLNPMFRQGSCILRTEVIDAVKHNDGGSPIKRLRKRSAIVHSKNIAGRTFWNNYPSLLKELGGCTIGESLLKKLICYITDTSFLKELYYTMDINKVEPDYVRSFYFENRLMPSTWVVIRIDGCHFHRLTEVHEFVKPNDEQALNLMNSCAAAVVTEFEDIVFSYGVSDEYSFILKKSSQFYQRQTSEIISVIVSFTSSYVLKWKDFFPQKELKYPPHFDGRAVCYPSKKIVRDYLAWRQVDCKHFRHQFLWQGKKFESCKPRVMAISTINTTLVWELVKSGKNKSEAQNFLKGTQAGDKEKLLKQFGIDYNKLPVMFRHGSSVFRDKEDEECVVGHYNIIEPSSFCCAPNNFSWITIDAVERCFPLCLARQGSS